MKRKKSKRRGNKAKYKPSKVKHLLNELFMLNTKRVLIILGLWVLFVIAHNVVSVLFGFEEAVLFFISTIIIPLYFLISIFYLMKSHWGEGEHS